MKVSNGLGALLLGIASSSALATPITYDFAGTVTYTTNSLGLSLPAVGTAFTGFLTYDDAALPNGSGPTFATYVDLITAFQVDYSGVMVSNASTAVGPYSPQSSEASVTNDRSDGHDGFTFQVATSLLAGDPANTYRNLTLSALTDNTALSTTALPSTLPDLSAWQINFLTLTYAEYSADNTQVTGNGEATGALTSLSKRATASVPEPSTLALFLGLLALPLFRRFQTRH